MGGAKSPVLVLADPQPCDEPRLLRYDPVTIAGGPIAANIMKCQLKPLDVSDYTVTFTSTEWAQLQTIFPNGVCDWSRRGVHQTGVVPWASFGPSRVNLVFDVNSE